MHCSVAEQRKNIWCLDSGATSHMCCDKSMFTLFAENKATIMLAADKFVESPGIGTVTFKTEYSQIEMREVLYVPTLHMNFLSINKAAQNGNSTSFDAEEALIKNKQGKIMLRAMLKNNLYVYTMPPETSAVYMLNDISLATKWHNRFGHLNFQSLKQISEKNLVHGFKIDNMPTEINCDTCNQAKLCALPFPQKANRVTERVLELIHTDVCGPMNVKSPGGNRYFVTFIDDFSRKIYVYFMRAKSEVFEKFNLFKSYVECQTGQKIKTLRSDNGKEYINNDFINCLNKCGIKRQLTVPYTPQQNGVAERANRTIVEMAKSLLIHAQLEEFLWAEAVKTAVYLRNRCPTKALNGQTPFEIWKNRKPSVKHLRVFGSRAFAVDKKRKGKFQAKSKEYIFVGYSSAAKAYRLYDRQKREIVERRDVKFVEGDFDAKVTEKCNISDRNDDFSTNIIRFESNIESPEQDSATFVQAKAEPEQHNSSNSTDSSEEEKEFVLARDSDVQSRPPTPKSEEVENVSQSVPRRPKSLRIQAAKQRHILNNLNSVDDIEAPQSVADALKSKHANDWQLSMQKEYDALMANNTWSLVNLPSGKKAIGSKWVFRIKRNKEGEIEKYKSRLVAKGCGQQFGVNYWETFSPVIRYETIRMLFAIAAEKQLHMHQVDISNAYLNSKLQEDVYMRQPENFVDKQHPNKVLKLQKAIYGLKQSGRAWNNTLDEVIQSMDFKRCKNEPCLYVKDHQQQFSYIAVYVDDLIIICPTEDDINEIKQKIALKFEMQDGGQLNFFLGMEIYREGKQGAVSLCQKKYIRSLLDNYSMQHCRPVATPLDPGFQVGCTNEKCAKVNITQYQSLIGSLMYLAVLSRPDIMHAISKLSQRNTDPHVEHETAAKHVLRYLAGTINLSIVYRKSNEPVKGFADADWANDQVDRKSYSGYTFFLGNSAFSWASSKQSIVALSSTEAEYVALSAAAKEAVYLRRILAEIGWSISEPMTIYGDNISSQSIARNPVHHKRTKHIDIKYHFIREKVETNEIELKYISTDKNVADVLTKSLCKQKHNGFVKDLGLM